MKHCKSVEFLSVFMMPSRPPHKRKAPLLKLSSSGSESAFTADESRWTQQPSSVPVSTRNSV